MSAPARFVIAVWVALLLCGLSQAAFGETEQDAAAEKLPLQNLTLLPAEELGEPAQVLWADLLLTPLRATDGHYVQLMWRKEYNDATRERLTRFMALNLKTGAIKTFPPVAGLQPWKDQMMNGKLYIGMNLGGHLLEFDPATESLRDLGKIFDVSGTTASMCAGPDGVLACGSTGGSEVTLYDQNAGQVVKYGAVGEGYIYYIGLDREYIYAADRGNQWQLVVIDRKTRDREVVMTVGPHGYMTVYGDRAAVSRTKGADETWYRFEKGKPVPLTAAEAAKARAGGQPKEPAPEVLLDTVSAVQQGKALVYYRLPENKPAKEDPAAAPEKNGWRRSEFEAAVDRSGAIALLGLMDDGRIVTTPHSYGGVSVYDTRTGKSAMLGITDLSIRSVVVSARQVFVAGYPGGLARIDPDRPFTSETALPGRPAVPKTDQRANPFFAGWIGKDVGGAHDIPGMVMGADRRLYYVGMRFRYLKGFGVGWFDPATGEHGGVEDGNRLTQLQVSWMCSFDGGRRAAISTRVQADPLVKQPPPDAARVLVFDTEKGLFAGEYTPLPGVGMLGPLAGTGPDTLIGLAPDEKNGVTTVYKLDLKTGKCILKRAYKGIICGVSSKGDLPRKGHDFLAGPDGWIWTLIRFPPVQEDGREKNYSALLRIDPRNLEIKPVGKVDGNSIRLLFKGRDLYLTGKPRLRLIKSIIPAA